MGKAKSIMWVIVGVGMVYAVLAIFIRFLADTSVSVNADMAAAHNMAQYPGASDFLLAIPWIAYILPAVIGIAIVVYILKRKEVNGL